LSDTVSSSTAARRQRLLKESLTDLDVFSCLALLNKPPRWLNKVTENVTINRDELHRHVRVQLTVPYDDYAMLSDPDAVPADRQVKCSFVALRPRKGTLVTVTEPEVLGQPSRRLSHLEHVTLCKSLILSRFLSVWAEPMREAVGRGEERWADQCMKIGAELVTLPELDKTEALEKLSTHFDESGIPLWRTEQLVNPDASHRLFKLCQELCERYYVVFQCLATVGGQVTLEYTYREHWYEAIGRRRLTDRLREALGAMPSAIRIHTPYARLCDHYEMRMDAPDGHYFYEQRVLAESEATHPKANSARTWGAATRRILERRHDPTSGMQEVGDPPTPASSTTKSPQTGRTVVSREVGGGTTAHLFVGNGRARKRTLYAGFRLFEVPPGSYGTAALLLLFAVGLNVLLLLWLHEFRLAGVASDVPALLVGLGSIVPAAAQALLPKSDLVRSPLLARVYLVGQSTGMLLFAVWLLSRSSGLPQPHSHMARFWYDHGGQVIAIILAITLLHCLRRLKRGLNTYSRVIEKSRI